MLIMMAAVWPLNAEAQNDVSVWDGFAESWTQGDGTENNPYLIENARQLAYIAEMVNAGVTHYDSTYFKLTTDILIDSTTAWEPIGLDGTYYFAGHFDGDNHIVALYLNTSSLRYIGLFGYIRNSSIKNLTSGGEIYCLTSVNVDVYVGGMVGYNYGNIIISNCHNIGKISCINNSFSSSVFVGGISGACTDGIILNSHNSGEISYTSYSNNALGTVGGITGVGHNLFMCYNTGNISSSLGHIGGIAGSLGNIINCYNTGNVSSTSSYTNVGGIVGLERDTIILCRRTEPHTMAIPRPSPPSPVTCR